MNLLFSPLSMETLRQVRFLQFQILLRIQLCKNLPNSLGISQFQKIPITAKLHPKTNREFRLRKWSKRQEIRQRQNQNRCLRRRNIWQRSYLAYSATVALTRWTKKIVSFPSSLHGWRHLEIRSTRCLKSLVHGLARPLTQQVLALEDVLERHFCIFSKLCIVYTQCIHFHLISMTRQTCIIPIIEKKRDLFIFFFINILFGGILKRINQS